jgi:serine/threonine protein kinase
MALLTGTRLGSYEILSPIGVGGTGEVYQTHELHLNRDVAVKVLLNLSTDPKRLHRFEQEARAAGALNHPNILAVFHMGSYEGAPYLVSDLLTHKTVSLFVSWPSFRDRLSLFSTLSDLFLQNRVLWGIPTSHLGSFGSCANCFPGFDVA